jgi:hypothetical protein
MGGKPWVPDAELTQKWATGRKHKLCAYGPECAEPFLEFAARRKTVMMDLEQLSLLDMEVLADLLHHPDICLETEAEFLKVSSDGR